MYSHLHPLLPTLPADLKLAGNETRCAARDYDARTILWHHKLAMHLHDCPLHVWYLALL